MGTSTVAAGRPEVRTTCSLIGEVVAKLTVTAGSGALRAAAGDRVTLFEVRVTVGPPPIGAGVKATPPGVRRVVGAPALEVVKILLMVLGRLMLTGPAPLVSPFVARVTPSRGVELDCRVVVGVLLQKMKIDEVFHEVE